MSNINKILAGAFLWMAVATIGCGGNDAPFAPNAADPAPPPAAGDTQPDAKTDVIASPTVADLVGDWAAESFVENKPDGTTDDLLMQFDAGVTLSMDSGGNAKFLFANSQGGSVADADQVQSLTDKELTFEKQGKAFSVVIGKDQMAWKGMPYNGGTADITWKRKTGGSNPTPPDLNALTLENLQGKWNVTSYLLDDGAGKKTELLGLWFNEMKVAVGPAGDVSTYVAWKNGGTDASSYSLTIMDAAHLAYGATPPFLAVLSSNGQHMTWSDPANKNPYVIEFKRMP